MKQGLDAVTSKVQALIVKVKENNYPTSDGITYLEAKHLLLLNYCQSIVYYLLRKAKGLSIDGHPVVRSLVEIRVFLEKYQIQKLTSARVTDKTTTQVNPSENESGEKTEDLLRYCPNPDMLISKTDMTAADGTMFINHPNLPLLL